MERWGLEGWEGGLLIARVEMEGWRELQTLLEVERVCVCVRASAVGVWVCVCVCVGSHDCHVELT